MASGSDRHGRPLGRADLLGDGLAHRLAPGDVNLDGLDCVFPARFGRLPRVRQPARAVADTKWLPLSSGSTTSGYGPESEHSWRPDPLTGRKRAGPPPRDEVSAALDAAIERRGVARTDRRA